MKELKAMLEKKDSSSGPIENLFYNEERLQEVGSSSQTLRDCGMHAGAVVLHETELFFLLKQLSHIPTPELSQRDRDEVLRTSNMQVCY